jgi:hypothetical protein
LLREALFLKNELNQKEPAMNGRPRTKASKKRRLNVKKERRLKKTISRVMPMLSRRKKPTV